MSFIAWGYCNGQEPPPPFFFLKENALHIKFKSCLMYTPHQTRNMIYIDCVAHSKAWNLIYGVRDGVEQLLNAVGSSGDRSGDDWIHGL